MTTRSSHDAGGGDVSATLGELERKLRELEQELNAGTRPAAAAAPPPPAPPTPEPEPPPAPAAPAPDADALLAQARARLGTLDGQVDELLRFREELHRTARELEEEYSRVLARIGAPEAPPAPAPAPALEPPPVPAPAPVRAPLVPPVAEAAPVPPAPAAPAAASPHEDTPFDGAIVLDAGPFTDIAALSAFEQGLAHVTGAEDVYVSGFEGNRAIVELRLTQPIALVREMRQAVPAPFVVAEAASGRLRLDVTAALGG